MRSTCFAAASRLTRRHGILTAPDALHEDLRGSLSATAALWGSGMVSRLKRIGLIALLLSITAIGLLMVMSGAEGAQLTGWALLLFCAGGGLIGFTVYGPLARQRNGFRNTFVTHRGQPHPAFVADYDRRRMLLGSAGLLGFAIAGVFIAASALGPPTQLEPLLVGLACMGLFGGLGVFGLLRARTGSQLALTRDGLLATGPVGPIFIEWDAMSSVDEIEMHHNRFLAVRADHSSRVESGPVQAISATLQRSLIGADLTFPLAALTVESSQLRAAMARYLNEPELRARIGADTELAALAVVANAGERRTGRATDQAAPLAPTLAAGSLVVVGTLLGLFSLAAFFGEGAAEPRTGRLIGGALLSVLALAQLGAGALVIRGARIARWPGIAGAVVLAGLGVVGLVAADPAQRWVGSIVAGLAVGHAVLVIWGLRGTGWLASGRGESALTGDGAGG